MKVLKLTTDPYSSFYNTVAGKQRSIPRRALAVTAIALSALTMIIPAGLIIHSLVHRVKKQDDHPTSQKETPGEPETFANSITPAPPTAPPQRPKFTHAILVNGERDLTGLNTKNKPERLLKHFFGDQKSNYKITQKAGSASQILIALEISTDKECFDKKFEADRAGFLKYFKENREELINKLLKLGYIEEK